jgi:thiol-disulfide isomerase/thioredoxin
MPDLTGATEWINGAPDASALAGHPVLVHFWALSCHICHENMPRVGEWREAYVPKGLVVIGVHMPRMESDTDVASVRADAAAMGLTEPVAIDNQHQIGAAFGNEFVPAYFLFDAEGKLAGRAAGYNGIAMIEPPLKRLMGV